MALTEDPQQQQDALAGLRAALGRGRVLWVGFLVGGAWPLDRMGAFAAGVSAWLGSRQQLCVLATDAAAVRLHAAVQQQPVQRNVFAVQLDSSEPPVQHRTRSELRRFARTLLQDLSETPQQETQAPRSPQLAQDVLQEQEALRGAFEEIRNALPGAATALKEYR